MTQAATQLGALQQLGVSYTQLLDYTSTEHIATFVGPTDDVLAGRSRSPM
jgi:hypothetical protein